MKLQIEIPEGQEAAIFEQTVYGMAGADAVKRENPETETSAMYQVFQQIINQLGKLIPDEQRKAIYMQLNEKLGNTPLAIVKPSENGEERMPETGGEPIPPREPEEPQEPTPENDEGSNDQ